MLYISVLLFHIDFLSPSILLGIPSLTFIQDPLQPWFFSKILYDKPQKHVIYFYLFLPVWIWNPGHCEYQANTLSLSLKNMFLNELRTFSRLPEFQGCRSYYGDQPEKPVSVISSKSLQASSSFLECRNSLQ